MSLQHIQKNSPRLLPKPAKFEKNPPNGYRVIRKTKCGAGGAGGAAGAGGAGSSPIHKQASLAGHLITYETSPYIRKQLRDMQHYLHNVILLVKSDWPYKHPECQTSVYHILGAVVSNFLHVHSVFNLVRAVRFKDVRLRQGKVGVPHTIALCIHKHGNLRFMQLNPTPVCDHHLGEFCGLGQIQLSIPQRGRVIPAGERDRLNIKSGFYQNWVKDVLLPQEILSCSRL